MFFVNRSTTLIFSILPFIFNCSTANNSSSFLGEDKCLTFPQRVQPSDFSNLPSGGGMMMGGGERVTRFCGNLNKCLSGNGVKDVGTLTYKGEMINGSPSGQGILCTGLECTFSSGAGLDGFAKILGTPKYGESPKYVGSFDNSSQLFTGNIVTNNLNKPVNNYRIQNNGISLIWGKKVSQSCN